MYLLPLSLLLPMIELSTMVPRRTEISGLRRKDSEEFVKRRISCKVGDNQGFISDALCRLTAQRF